MKNQSRIIQAPFPADLCLNPGGGHLNKQITRDAARFLDWDANEYSHGISVWGIPLEVANKETIAFPQSSECSSRRRVCVRTAEQICGEVFAAVDSKDDIARRVDDEQVLKNKMLYTGFPPLKCGSIEFHKFILWICVYSTK